MRSSFFIKVGSVNLNSIPFMKNTKLATIATVFSILILSAFSNGIATPPNGQNRTGAGGTQADCSGSGCHSANNSNLGISIIPVDLVNNDTVNAYTPNTPYKIRIWANFSSGGSYPKFGFQFAAQQQNGLGAGNYFNTPGLHAIPIGLYEIIETTQPKSTYLSRCIDSINWIAPPKNSGTVTLYATVLAANNDGFATGDISNSFSRIMSEHPTGIDESNNEPSIVLYPNFAHEHLSLDINNAISKEFLAVVINQCGSLMKQESFKIDSNHWSTAIDVSGFAPGNYLLYLRNGNLQKTLKFVVY